MKKDKLIIEIIEMVESNMVGIMDKKTIADNLQDLLKEPKQVKKLNIDDVSKRYSEQDMLNAAKYGYEYRDTTSFPEMGFDSNCKNNTRQWLTTVK